MVAKFVQYRDDWLACFSMIRGKLRALLVEDFLSFYWRRFIPKTTRVICSVSDLLFRCQIYPYRVSMFSSETLYELRFNYARYIRLLPYFLFNFFIPVLLLSRTRDNLYSFDVIRRLLLQWLLDAALT
jgi:hypothetical protein